jgi:sec-independent protein translocase protein TatB
MIDLGLAKIALIGVVALVVIGPEKLPKVARMAGSLYGRAQRYLAQVKSEVSHEIALDELRQIHKDVQETGLAIGRNLAAAENDFSGNYAGSPLPIPTQVKFSREYNTRKAQDFRRKKLHRTSAIPAWYKQQHGTRARVISAAARVARYRPGAKTSHSFFQ